MSVPDELVDEIRTLKNATDSGSPVFSQLAMAELLRSGDYDRHVARARQVYRRRRDAIVASLGRRLPRLEVCGVAAGLHVLLRLPDGVDDTDGGARRSESADRGRAALADGPRWTRRARTRAGLQPPHRDRVDDAVAALAASLSASGVRGGPMRST